MEKKQLKEEFEKVYNLACYLYWECVLFFALLSRCSLCIAGRDGGMGAEPPTKNFWDVFGQFWPVLCFSANGFQAHCNLIPVKGLGL